MGKGTFIALIQAHALDPILCIINAYIAKNFIENKGNFTLSAKLKKN